MFPALIYKGRLSEIRFAVSRTDNLVLVHSLGASQILLMRGVIPRRKCQWSIDGPQIHISQLHKMYSKRNVGTHGLKGRVTQVYSI